MLVFDARRARLVINNVLILHVQQLEQLLLAVQRCIIRLWWSTSTCGQSAGGL